MANSKVGGVVKTTPPKTVKGFVWADKRRCDWSDKNDVIDTGIYSGERRFFEKRMETDKCVTLVSEASNNNFTVHFINWLTFGGDWEVALVQAYLPHRDSYFQETFKSYFPNNKVVGGLSVHYNTSLTATSSASKTTTVRIDGIINGIGRGTSKLDVLKMIYSAAWNKIMYEL